MSTQAHLQEDPIFVALQALHFPLDELADALGLELSTLAAYCGGERAVPAWVVRRLAAVLQHRARYLRDVAALLDDGGAPVRLALAS